MLMDPQARRDRTLRLLPPPQGTDYDDPTRLLAHTPPHFVSSQNAGGAGWSKVTFGRPAQRDIVREQRDGLARLRDRLLARVRRLEAENASLRQELERYRRYLSAQEREQELADAERLQEELGIEFDRMPDTVYPGKPYVTQLDLIRRGITAYSRQNISRMTRDEKSVPAVQIADRVLIPPCGVRVLLEREKLAAKDVSPRRRPGSARRAEAERE